MCIRDSHVEREPEHERHDGDERGDGREGAGQQLVDARAARVLATLGRLHHRLLAHAADEAEPHVGDGRRAVEAAFGLHLADDVLERVLLVLVEVEPIEHQLVAFGQLARGEPRRDARALGMVLDERHDAVQAAMDGPVVLVGRAEVLAHGRSKISQAPPPGNRCPSRRAGSTRELFRIIPNGQKLYNTCPTAGVAQS